MPSRLPLAELRSRAHQARQHAQNLWPHAAAQQLLCYARELDEAAEALERDSTRHTLRRDESPRAKAEPEVQARGVDEAPLEQTC